MISVINSNVGDSLRNGRSLQAPCKLEVAYFPTLHNYKDSSMEKKFNFVYKTTNLINEKIYIGVHSTDNLDDGYLGSGNRIIWAISKYGKENFKREILNFFETRKQCYQQEKVLVTTTFIERSDVYNLTEGGYGVITHSLEGLKSISEHQKNKAVMKDENGIIHQVDKDSEEYKMMIGHTAGMVCAKNSLDTEFFISKTEFDNDESLVGRTKGQMHVTLIETGKTIFIYVNEYDKNIHKRFSMGKVAVKDIDNNIFQVSINDPKYLSGELVGVMKGKTFKHKKKAKTIKCPYCEKCGNVSNMYRWHFDNCKFKA